MTSMEFIHLHLTEVISDVTLVVYARVSHEMAQFVIKIAHLHWRFQCNQPHNLRRYPVTVSFLDCGCWF